MIEIEYRLPIGPRTQYQTPIAHFIEDFYILHMLERVARQCADEPYGCHPVRHFAWSLARRVERHRTRVQRVLESGYGIANHLLRRPIWDESGTHPFELLALAVEFFAKDARPFGRLQRTANWASAQIAVLREGLDDRKTPGLFPGEVPASELFYRGHARGSLYADMQAMHKLLPHLVAAMEYAAKGSPLSMYAECLYEDTWAHLLALAPQVADATFMPGRASQRRTSDQKVVWSRLWDATTIAQAQADPSGRLW
ncbi:MAG: hypothetical protein EOO21_06750, partial [Comamonadaceae bacterium]